MKRSISHAVSPRGTTRWSFIDAATEMPPGPGVTLIVPTRRPKLLWNEAQEMYGERAHEFAFLRTYGLGSVQGESFSLADLRV